MPRAFLKKKSLLDRYKDAYGWTNPIKSARSEHQWSNPIIRHKREKGANRWIDSFQGRNHIHKLARFNAQQATRNEDMNKNISDFRNKYGNPDELPKLSGIEKTRFDGMAEQIDVLINMYADKGSLSKPQLEQLKKLRDGIVVFGVRARPIVDDADFVLSEMGVAESKKPADEKLGYEKGHKNSKGENAPWVIRSHEDNRVLASFATKKDAEEHMKRMKQYSKQESKSTDEFDKYIKDVKSLLKSKYGLDFNDKDTCRLNVGWMDKLDAMHYQGKSVEDCAKNVAAFCGYDKYENKQSEEKRYLMPEFKKANTSKKEAFVDNSATAQKDYIERVISAVQDYYGYDLFAARNLVQSNAEKVKDWYMSGEVSDVEAARCLGGNCEPTKKENVTETRDYSYTIKDGARFYDMDNARKILSEFANDVKADLGLDFEWDGPFTYKLLKNGEVLESGKILFRSHSGIAELFLDGGIRKTSGPFGSLTDVPASTKLLHWDRLYNTNESKKSESKDNLVDTVVAPKWLWESYTLGDKYENVLTPDEKETLETFNENYGNKYHLKAIDDGSEFRSLNDFDNNGGPCYTVEVYKK